MTEAQALQELAQAIKNDIKDFFWHKYKIVTSTERIVDDLVRGQYAEEFVELMRDLVSKLDDLRSGKRSDYIRNTLLEFVNKLIEKRGSLSVSKRKCSWCCCLFDSSAVDDDSVGKQKVLFDLAIGYELIRYCLGHSLTSCRKDSVIRPVLWGMANLAQYPLSEDSEEDLPTVGAEETPDSLRRLAAEQEIIIEKLKRALEESLTREKEIAERHSSSVNTVLLGNRTTLNARYG